MIHWGCRCSHDEGRIQLLLTLKRLPVGVCVTCQHAVICPYTLRHILDQAGEWILGQGQFAEFLAYWGTFLLILQATIVGDHCQTVHKARLLVVLIVPAAFVSFATLYLGVIPALLNAPWFAWLLPCHQESLPWSSTWNTCWMAQMESASITG